jgi:uncharacterized protein (DUF362 family)
LVALRQVRTYDPPLLRRELIAMLDALGGLGALVKTGARVGIKVNLTGQTNMDREGQPPAPEYFVTHPAVVGALSELLIDAGAAEISIVDGIGDEANFSKWGYTDMAKPLGVKLVDLCQPDPYSGYARFPTGPQALQYEFFYCHAGLRELDVFISVAKMKCHSVAGVTLALKNLFGLVPISAYRRQEAHNHRSAFHESTQYDSLVPKIILDLNLARPIDLAIVDGVMTAEGGAGPWDAGLAPVRPGVLIASRDPVAADAVAAAVMGFQPEAASGALPFSHCDNYLAMAHALGLGTHRLAEIGVLGTPVKEVVLPFKPAG